MNYAVGIPLISKDTEEPTTPIPLQGAGVLRIDLSINGKSSISPSKLSLGYVQSTGSVQRQFTITNSHSAAMDYNLTSLNAQTINITETANVQQIDVFTNVRFLANNVAITTVHLESGQSQAITVEITPNSTLDTTNELFFFNGMIVVTPSGSDDYPCPSRLEE